MTGEAAGVLRDVRFSCTGGLALSRSVVARHLRLFGAVPVDDAGGGGRALSAPSPPHDPARVQIFDASHSALVHGAISWYGRSGVHPTPPGSEAAVQGLSGLMGANGRDEGRPARIGIEIASVIAGVLGVQALLAALIARSRGRLVDAVETSALQAALVPLTHYLAVATCGDELTAPTEDEAPGPPFRTAEGHWVELECLDPEAWGEFWHSLGIPRREVGRAWHRFVYRYVTAECTVPAGFREAFAARTVADLDVVAKRSGVEIRRLRDYAEVLRDAEVSAWPAGRGPWSIRTTPIVGPSPPVGRHHGGVTSELPLAGLRVVEATSRTQGPLAGLLLSMLGAEVTRVEPPGGDLARGMPPFAGDTGACFLAVNRGKEAVEADLGTMTGRRMLLEMVTDADVFLQNWRPSRATRLGLGFDQLNRANPGVVYAAAAGWGEEEDSDDAIATDFMVQAHTGLAHGLRPVDEPPSPSRVIIVDVMGGLIACEAVLAGLYLRERSGRGCRVGTSLASAATELQAHVLADVVSGREHGRRHGRPVWRALDRPLETADGYVTVTVEDEENARRLGCVCGLDLVPPGPPDGDERVLERLRARPSAEWEELFAGEGIPCAAVCTDLAALPTDRRVAPLLEPIAGAWAPAAPWSFE